MDILNLYKNCRLCPRNCGVDRFAGAAGYCRESSQLRLAFAGLHSGEEPPLSGSGGSGTIFISGCNLGCISCQNWQISSNRFAENLGRGVSAEEFAAICIKLMKTGSQNINIVTGSHAIPAIVTGINAAKNSGLQIPVLWNSSGYESTETLELLKNYVDMYLPDLKTLDNALSEKFSAAPDYPQAAKNAISWMVKNRPGNVIVRHLIIPGKLDNTRSVMRWFANNVIDDAQLSLMSQYTPIAGTQERSPGRFLSKLEYETVLCWLSEFGIENGFCQELHTGSDWLPDFRRPNPFSSELSVPLWHYNY
jgi:putative pyruvate formate lyase activating enzyme